MYEYDAFVLRVIDGDTIVVNIDLGFNIVHRTTIRLQGIDTHEITLRGDTTPKEKEIGLKAKQWLENLIEGCHVTLHTGKETKGKYGRWIARVFLKEGDLTRNINAELVEKGFTK